MKGRNDMFGMMRVVTAVAGMAAGLTSLVAPRQAVIPLIAIAFMFGIISLLMAGRK